MKLRKREKQLLDILNKAFDDYKFDESIFTVEDDLKGLENYADFEITKSYISVKIYMNIIELDRYYEFLYDKLTGKIYTYIWSMKAKRTSFKILCDDFLGEKK